MYQYELYQNDTPVFIYIFEKWMQREIQLSRIRNNSPS